MDGDILGGDARRFQLRAVGRPKIEEESAAAAAADELPGKLGRDLAAHFVAAGSDRGSEPGPDILRPLAEPDQGGHARRRGVFRGAAPARVDDSDGPLPGQDDRNAVGRLHDQTDPGQVRGERIALTRITDLRRGGRLPDRHRAVTMDLCRAHERDSWKSERGGKAAPEKAGRGRLTLRSGPSSRERDHDSSRRANRPENQNAVICLFEPAVVRHVRIVESGLAESCKLKAASSVLEFVSVLARNR